MGKTLGYSTVFVCCILAASALIRASRPDTIWLRREGRLVPIVRTQNLGAIRQGSTTMVRFLLRNDHLNAVKIVGVESGCGCASASVNRDQVETSETIEVDVRVNAGDRLGVLAAVLSIEYELPNSRRDKAYVEVRAEVIPIEVVP